MSELEAGWANRSYRYDATLLAALPSPSERRTVRLNADRPPALDLAVQMLICLNIALRLLHIRTLPHRLAYFCQVLDDVCAPHLFSYVQASTQEVPSLAHGETANLSRLENADITYEVLTALY